MPLPAGTAYAIALVGGALLWIVTSAATGRNEAWDAQSYWTLAYPLSIALAGALAWYAPDRPWRWALAVMVSQALVLAATAGGFGLLPLGLLLFAVLALPGIAVANAVARMRRRQGAG